MTEPKLDPLEIQTRKIVHTIKTSDRSEDDLAKALMKLLLSTWAKGVRLGKQSAEKEANGHDPVLRLPKNSV